jgi:hypothetical protein
LPNALFSGHAIGRAQRIKVGQRGCRGHVTIVLITSGLKRAKTFSCFGDSIAA